MPYMAHQDEYGASGNSDDGAGKMGAIGISGVEVVGDDDHTCLSGISVSDSESSKHRQGKTRVATDTGGSELSDGSAFDDE
ncbi:hypothetical protein Tco_0080863 [Tanacetum coccineum]